MPKRKPLGSTSKPKQPSTSKPRTAISKPKRKVEALAAPKVMPIPEDVIDLCDDTNQDTGFAQLLAIKTVIKILDNVLDNPSEEKYQRLRKSNESLQSRVLAHPGGVDMLLAAGFVDDGQFFVLRHLTSRTQGARDTLRAVVMMNTSRNDGSEHEEEERPSVRQRTQASTSAANPLVSPERYMPPPESQNMTLQDSEIVQVQAPALAQVRSCRSAIPSVGLRAMLDSGNRGNTLISASTAESLGIYNPSVLPLKFVQAKGVGGNVIRMPVVSMVLTLRDRAFSLDVGVHPDDFGRDHVVLIGRDVLVPLTAAGFRLAVS